MRTKVKADVTPWSSTVGNSVVLKNEKGAVCAMLMISPDPGCLIKDAAERKAWAQELAAHVAKLINKG